MHFQLQLETPIIESFRVRQTRGLFDLPESRTARAEFDVQLSDMDEDWQIGVIVGPSGSGKSTIAKAAYGDNVITQQRWPTDRAVIDALPRGPIKRVTGMLSAVGFASPPSWLKPYHVLSTGEQFRCDLAAALLSEQSLIVFDEFTSVVDRTAAQIGSAAVARTIRKGSRQQEQSYDDSNNTGRLRLPVAPQEKPPLPRGGEGRGEGATPPTDLQDPSTLQPPHPACGHLLPQGGEGSKKDEEQKANGDSNSTGSELPVAPEPPCPFALSPCSSTNSTPKKPEAHASGSPDNSFPFSLSPYPSRVPSLQPLAPSKFIAVTCHYDILPWLQADWVLDMACGTLQRGRLRRPQIEIEIRRCKQSAWQTFARHHYLSDKLNPAAVCYLATWRNEPVAFCAVLNAIGHVGVRRISRLVVLPDYQGVGIGGRFMDAIADIYHAKGDRLTITTSHPAMIARLRASPRWAITRVRRGGSTWGKFAKRKNIRSTSFGRTVVGAEAVGERLEARG